MDVTARRSTSGSERKPATRADVARLAGVSTGTVSHVVHGSAAIRPETRRRVEEAMTELGYAPNLMASGLAGGRSGILALMFRGRPRAISGTDLEYVFAVTETAREHGFHVVVWSADVDELQEPRASALLRVVEGVLLMQVDVRDERIPYFRKVGIPVGLVGRTSMRKIPYADADFGQIAHDAVAHLHDLGHRRVALLGVEAGTEESSSAAFHFRAAVDQACERAGMTVRHVLSEPTVQSGRKALADLVDSTDEITGVLCFNWEAAVGLLQEAHHRGVDVPADLSVLLCGNGDPEFSEPALTSISPPPQEIAVAAVTTMIEQLRGGGARPRQVLVPAELQVRGTTSKARR